MITKSIGYKRTPSIYKIQTRIEKTSELVACLPCMHEDPSSDPQDPHKTAHGASISPAGSEMSVRQRQEDFWSAMVSQPR